MTDKQPDEAEALAAKFAEEGVPVEIAVNLAKIALRNDSSAPRPTVEATDEVINKIAARVVVMLGERAELEKRALFQEDLRNFFISFSASAAFGLVQYILAVNGVFTAAADPKMLDGDLAQVRNARQDAAHRRLSDADRTFLSKNLASLAKVHTAFRSELVDAVRRSGIAGGVEQLIALVVASLIEEQLIAGTESPYGSVYYASGSREFD